MQFMAVYRFKPNKRDAVIQRRLEKGPLVPAGVKILGEWAHIGGGRVFRLIDCDDPVALNEAAHAWSDLGKLKFYPVMESEKLLKSSARK